jgi:hypothetical protein
MQKTHVPGKKERATNGTQKSPTREQRIRNPKTYNKFGKWCSASDSTGWKLFLIE